MDGVKDKVKGACGVSSEVSACAGQLGLWSTLGGNTSTAFLIGCHSKAECERKSGFAVGLCNMWLGLQARWRI